MPNKTAQSGADALTVAKVARSLGLVERTVRGLVATGEIPSFRIGGSRRIPSRWLEQKLEESARAAR